MRTAEQVARDTLGADALNGIGYERYLPHMIAAIEADRKGKRVYVVLSEEGGVIDVTTNEEWAEYVAHSGLRDSARTIHVDTLWDGPKSRAKWED